MLGLTTPMRYTPAPGRVSMRTGLLYVFILNTGQRGLHAWVTDTPDQSLSSSSCLHDSCGSGGSDVGTGSPLRFAEYANWLLPGKLMVGRFPGRELDPAHHAATDSAAVAAARMTRLISVARIGTFVSLQAETPPPDGTGWLLDREATGTNPIFTAGFY